MYERLGRHFEDVCDRYFGLTHACRVALAVDWYDVGTLQYYRGCFCVWCKHACGIFALLHQPSDCLLGYVLLVDGRAVEFFTDMSDPLDWWAWNRRSVRRTFHIDRGFGRSHLNNTL